ncbi:MAG: HAD family hydrolase [Clostridiales bacterium]|nr:HAD family hydrolase [Clostridiales bacterium]
MKGVVFDIGQTLAYYPFPLNWSALYRPAFERIADRFDLQISEAEYEHIGATLAKYNTRINPRETEVSSDVIFREIIEGTNMPMELLDDIKNEFYLFFRRDVVLYDEVKDTLKKLKDNGFLIGTLSDVAYGMDNKYALEDISEAIDYIDFPYTSNDVGYRKPSSKGLRLLSEKMNIAVDKIAFVGDEKKDVECAKNAGAIAVLINRDNEEKYYGQDYTIRSLDELFNLQF